MRWAILTIIMAVLLAGCSADEVIRVGTPFTGDGTDGVEFHHEVTDSEAIVKFRELIDEAEQIEMPSDLDEEPDTYFSLDRPNDSVSETERYVWYEDDGSAVLYNGFDYFVLTEEQTVELEKILEN